MAQLAGAPDAVVEVTAPQSRVLTAQKLLPCRTHRRSECSNRKEAGKHRYRAAGWTIRREKPGASEPHFQQGGVLRCTRGLGLTGSATSGSAAVRPLSAADLVGKDQSGSPCGTASAQGSQRDVLEGPQRSLHLLRVAVDVDEVLGSFLATLNLYIHEELSLKHELEEFFVYDFMKIWGCSQEEANQRVHSFFDSHHFEKGIPPIPGAFATLKRLAAFCDLTVVTSRQHVIREPTLEWIEAHYPGVFREVYFGNHFALSGPAAKPKSEMCREIGAQVLIDDNPKYALECARAGLNVLLFDWNLTYPWSKTEDGPEHPLIQRVKDWDEVEQVLKTLAGSRP